MSSCRLAEQMIFLTTCDGTEFMVMATMSQKMGNLIKNGCTYINIELPNITANVLKMVMEYSEIHVFKQKRTTKPCTALDEKEIENWDKELCECRCNASSRSYYCIILSAHPGTTGSCQWKFGLKIS
ncbi:SKP1-like protein 9 [Carex littledalei]|uniref:SKP1-like protein 9 n=1 Tax=Carex littledalei TaxID=544730 RepID=A0A833QP27_9POAL|nr:SKP1-like protein 9 [Carex littledalei]